eukprot:scaffold315_cov101-Isochrysis_galbana.AAC.5
MPFQEDGGIHTGRGGEKGEALRHGGKGGGGVATGAGPWQGRRRRRMPGQAPALERPLQAPGQSSRVHAYPACSARGGEGTG